jgi:hypothetical protein
MPPQVVGPEATDPSAAGALATGAAEATQVRQATSRSVAAGAETEARAPEAGYPLAARMPVRTGPRAQVAR